ncbi:DnaB-like helicase N-terminal domain-containing protein [Streptomyces sp. SCSIO 30461]|uniref:DnaB-like helicase N-terminal domain-containing protein n=1 Tax=Streptomyces sp. SCSIO 30461 TaxID=3118085 RepID=UPI0030D0BF9F
MPHPPSPYDDPVDLPPQPPVHYAEQALLGALLLEPHRSGDIAVHADQFGNHAHGALFAAIQAAPACGAETRRSDVVWLNAVLEAARPEAPGLSVSYLHALVQVCPSPGHAAVYAQVIQAEHARRRLREAALRLAQTARDTSLPHPVPTTLAEADALAGVVDDIAAAFAHGSGPLPRTPTPPAPVRDAEEAAEEERLLLATATANPADIAQMRWLTGDDFTHSLHAGLWHCLTALAGRRAPVDPITVVWEAQQRGVLHDHDPRDLLGFLAAPAESARHLGGRILHRRILDSAHRTGRHIAALTDDPATTPPQLVLGSRRALADLAAVRTRWHLATAPPSVRATPGPATAAPRAGPPPTTAPPPSRIAH